MSLVKATSTWSEEAASPAYWVRHLREPVRFSAGLATLLEWPAAVFLEVGPGQVRDLGDLRLTD